MKIPTLLLPLCMSTCLAQRWKIDQNCGNDIQALESAFNQARDLATNAYSVLEEHYGTDAHVQQMVKYILGDDANLQGKVDKVKTLKTNIVQLVYCDGSNYNTRTRDDGMVLHENKPMGGALVDNRDWPSFDACFNKDPQGSNTPVPMAITISSDGEDKKGWDRAVALWSATGANGAPPNRRDFARPRANLPNTINLCKWNIALQRETATGQRLTRT
ncbi:hypothetical protein PG984_015516 [Apiospora sp. TS-2023a]